MFSPFPYFYGHCYTFIAYFSDILFFYGSFILIFGSSSVLKSLNGRFSELVSYYVPRLMYDYDFLGFLWSTYIFGGVRSIRSASVIVIVFYFGPLNSHRFIILFIIISSKNSLCSVHLMLAAGLVHRHILIALTFISIAGLIYTHMPMQCSCNAYSWLASSLIFISYFHYRYRLLWIFIIISLSLSFPLMEEYRNITSTSSSFLNKSHHVLTSTFSLAWK